MDSRSARFAGWSALGRKACPFSPHVPNPSTPRVVLENGDEPRVVRLTLGPLQEEALWPTVRLLATLLERNATALTLVRVVVDYQ